MIVDSGASTVMLTADVANRLGLRPGNDTPRVTLVTADGSKVEGWVMKLDSVRLGLFTVDDVECAVLPDNVKADECLLGGTFLRHFIYRMDLASAQLFLTQISGKPKDLETLAGSDASTGPATRPASAGAAELLPTMKGNTDRKRNGAIVLQTGERIMTAKPYAPPVTFTIVAQTDSTNIRFGYAADHIIFNWELDPTHFRIDGGPAGGRHEPGAGKVPTRQWVEFELTVLPDEMIIRADGAERYRTRADFSQVKQPLAIFTERGGTIMVKSVKVAETP
jgi:clan AA aspartic protease (TIGR02281 family)